MGSVCVCVCVCVCATQTETRRVNDIRVMRGRQQHHCPGTASRRRRHHRHRSTTTTSTITTSTTTSISSFTHHHSSSLMHGRQSRCERSLRSSPCVAQMSPGQCWSPTNLQSTNYSLTAKTGCHNFPNRLLFRRHLLVVHYLWCLRFVNCVY